MFTCLMIGCLGLIALVVLVIVVVLIIGFSFDGEEAAVIKDSPMEEAVCYQGEMYNEQEQICMLEVPCQGTACAVWGDELIDELEGTYGSLDEFTYADDELIEEHILQEYEINQNAVVDDVPTDYLWQWQAFDWLTPDEYTTMIDEVEIFEGNETNAYVIVSQGISATLGLNKEPFIASETIQNTVHELAHLFSLRPDQVDYSVDGSACETLYTEEQGCFRENSYMYQFYEQFWLPNKADENWDNFMNDYAMTHEQEDFAESFTYFVLYPRPMDNRVVDQKLQFFYQYDEMITLRTELLARIATWLPRVEETL